MNRGSEREFHEVVVEDAPALDVDAPRVEPEVAPDVVGVSVDVEVFDGVLGVLARAVRLIHVRVDRLPALEERLQSLGVPAGRVRDRLGHPLYLLGRQAAHLSEGALGSLVEVHTSLSHRRSENGAFRSPGPTTIIAAGHIVRHMPEPLHVESGELTAEEILAALEAGRRVVVRAELLGAVHEVTLRHDGETFYCDTPTTLHKHSSVEEMRTCIDRMGYASDDGEE